MAELHIVTACTNRKRGSVGARRIGGLLDLPLEDRADAWWERLTSTPGQDATPAKDLYVGSHWQRSSEAAREATSSGVFDEVYLHVMSAGYGLVSASELLRPYAATFTRTSDDCVLRPEEDSETWWDALAQHELPSRAPRSLLELARHSGDATVVIAGSTQYLRAVASDVRTAARELAPDRLSVVCGGSVPGELREFELGLDGTKAVGLGARMVDLAAAAVVHLSKTVERHGFHRSKAREILAAVPSAPIPSAQRKARSASDEEVRDFIAGALSSPVGGTTKTALLRRLRSESEFACEYARFGRLFNEVVGAD